MTTDYSRIKKIFKVLKGNLILDKIRLNIPFNFAIPRPFHFFTSSVQVIFRFKSKTIYKANNTIKNIKCLTVFEFQVSAKLFGQELLDFGQPSLI